MDSSSVNQVRTPREINSPLPPKLNHILFFQPVDLLRYHLAEIVDIIQSNNQFSPRTQDRIQQHFQQIEHLLPANVCQVLVRLVKATPVRTMKGLTITVDLYQNQLKDLEARKRQLEDELRQINDRIGNTQLLKVQAENCIADIRSTAENVQEEAVDAILSFMSSM